MVFSSTGTHVPDASENLVWHKQVPLKVSIVAWRLPKDRLPTKLNLQRRGILQAAALYAFWGAAMMSLQHICSFIALFLARYGSIVGRGLACMEQILKILMTIFINLFTI